MKITVKKAVIVDRDQRNRVTKELMHFREQTAYAHVCERDGTPLEYPQKIIINHDEDGQPLAVGDYTVGDASFYIDGYSKLQIGALRCVPVGTGGAAAKGL